MFKNLPLFKFCCIFKGDYQQVPGLHLGGPAHRGALRRALQRRAEAGALCTAVAHGGQPSCRPGVGPEFPFCFHAPGHPLGLLGVRPPTTRGQDPALFPTLSGPTWRNSVVRGAAPGTRGIAHAELQIQTAVSRGRKAGRPGAAGARGLSIQEAASREPWGLGALCSAPPSSSTWPSRWRSSRCWRSHPGKRLRETTVHRNFISSRSSHA